MFPHGHTFSHGVAYIRELFVVCLDYCFTFLCHQIYLTVLVQLKQAFAFCHVENLKGFINLNERYGIHLLFELTRFYRDTLSRVVKNEITFYSL